MKSWIWVKLIHSEANSWDSLFAFALIFLIHNLSGCEATSQNTANILRGLGTTTFQTQASKCNGLGEMFYHHLDFASLPYTQHFLLLPLRTRTQT